MENKINWFPGHMKSALEMIKAELKLCDIIIYMLDARCPQSCINPKYEEFLSRKPVLFVLNKSDLAPNSKMPNAISLNSTLSGAGKKVIEAINKQLAAKINAASAKGITKTIRAIVIGVTNCGKSTFINNLAAKGKTLTGDRPGVTRTKQWVRLTPPLRSACGESARRVGQNPSPRLDFMPDMWLLDTPGTLWPKFDNPQVAKNLAYVGSIKDDILDIIALAKDLISDLQRLSPDCIQTRFGVSGKAAATPAQSTDSVAIFEAICRKRGYILKGGILDEERAAKAILTEFRAGKLGKFNLDELL